MAKPGQIIFCKGPQKVEITRKCAFEFNCCQVEQSFGISKVAMKSTVQLVFQCGSDSLCCCIESLWYVEVEMSCWRNAHRWKGCKGHSRQEYGQQTPFILSALYVETRGTNFPYIDGKMPSKLVICIDSLHDTVSQIFVFYNNLEIKTLERPLGTCRLWYGQTVFRKGSLQRKAHFFQTHSGYTVSVFRRHWCVRTHA